MLQLLLSARTDEEAGTGTPRGFLKCRRLLFPPARETSWWMYICIWFDHKGVILLFLCGCHDVCRGWSSSLCSHWGILCWNFRGKLQNQQRKCSYTEWVSFQNVTSLVNLLTCTVTITVKSFKLVSDFDCWFVSADSICTTSEFISLKIKYAHV